MRLPGRGRLLRHTYFLKQGQGGPQAEDRWGEGGRLCRGLSGQPGRASRRESPRRLAGLWPKGLNETRRHAAETVTQRNRDSAKSCRVTMTQQEKTQPRAGWGKGLLSRIGRPTWFLRRGPSPPLQALTLASSTL